MAYLIDGNNLMGQTPEIDLSSPDARQQLLRRLAAFRRLPGRRPQRITVVFDGPPEPNFPSGSSFQGVRILYPPPNADADTVIKQMVDQQKDRRALTVVTSDRSLYEYVRACGIRAVTCQRFNSGLEAAFEAAGVEEKVDVQLGSNEIEEWMRYFGVEAEQGQASDTRRHTSDLEDEV